MAELDNLRHISEEKLDAAITDLIDALNRFLLPRV